MTLLPHPDSPTRPRVSPGATLKLTSSAARTVPRRVGTVHRARSLPEAVSRSLRRQILTDGRWVPNAARRQSEISPRVRPCFDGPQDHRHQVVAPPGRPIDRLERAVRRRRIPARFDFPQARPLIGLQPRLDPLIGTAARPAAAASSR